MKPKHKTTRKPQNLSFHVAKATKQDEFYTQLSDIEKELRYYTKHFKGKTVLCNCDDPKVSNFFHYFSHNFEKLKLQKLITTCYKNCDAAMDNSAPCQFASTSMASSRLTLPATSWRSTIFKTIRKNRFSITN